MRGWKVAGVIVFLVSAGLGGWGVSSLLTAAASAQPGLSQPPLPFGVAVTSIVMRAKPVMRAVARRLLPSTRQETMWARSAVLNLFIIDIILTRASIVKLEKRCGMESIEVVLPPCNHIEARGGFVQRELDRIRAALREAPSPECCAKLHAAQQALSWAIEPIGFASPYDAIMGTPQAIGDCSETPHQPRS